MRKLAILALLGAGLAIQPVFAQSEVKVGMITTLSGPLGYLGEDIRDGFQLAIEQGGGKLGGVPVKLLVEDDAAKPGLGEPIAEKFLTRENAKILTGFVLSNVLAAIAPDALDAGTFVLTPNAAPSNFAGKDCNKNYFATAWQNDATFEAAGQNATNAGAKRAFILAPNFQAGKDALAGFKRFFKGQIVDETYTKLDQVDFGAELARIRAEKPDAVFQFHPAGLGIIFMRQYLRAGLGDIPMYVNSSGLDRRAMAAIGEAAVGVNVTAHWTADFDNPESKAFVTAFKAKYNRIPDTYASQGYDTALLIGSALKAVNGDLSIPMSFGRRC